MKIKKVGAICNAAGVYYLIDQRNAAGETVCQWLGDASALYPLEGLPYMELDSICAMYDLTEKKKEKCVLRHTDAPGDMNLGDTDLRERRLDKPRMSIWYSGRELVPLETSAGVVFIQEKYLASLGDEGYLELFERRTTGGSVYIVAKIGLLVQGVIMPVDAVTGDFVERLESLTDQCRNVLMKKRFVAQKRDDGEGENQNALFHVDGSTGEIIGEGAVNRRKP